MPPPSTDVHREYAESERTGKTAPRSSQQAGNSPVRAPHSERSLGVHPQPSGSEQSFPHIALSHIQAAPLLAARRAGLATAATSFNLGRTPARATLTDAGVTLPNGSTLPWEQVEAITDAPTACFLVEADGIRPIRVFSEHTGWLRALYPTDSAPTVLVSGVLMHRIKGTDPLRDTFTKIRAAAPLTGRVLDTATGLGYTAIEAARTATEVVTIELDPAALEVARLNPWSRELFERPNISQIVGDTAEEVTRFPDGHFARILHDPPAFALAGDLYGGVFYRELYRILTHGGRLFHYIGDLDSKSGAAVTRGVVRRLQESGFTRVVRRPEAFGLLAYR